MDRIALEKQLFDWEDWDEATGEVGDMAFYNVKLTHSIGEFAAGTEFPAAFWMAGSSLIVLVDDQDTQHTFELNVSVGKKIDLPQVSEGGCGCGHEH